LLLTHASDDIEDADTVRRLLRDLREVRMSKLRKGFRVLEGGAGLQINGVGGMEVAEVRGFVGGVVDGLRYAFLSFVCAESCCWSVLWNTVSLTISLTERSAARGKRLGESAKLRSGRTDLVAVLTLTRMMTICNYNVQFPFHSPQAAALALFLLWLHGYNAMRS
jgi:hypothetical protein